MKTEEFIAELAKRLAVLTEEERRDILEEYEQHIDMKSYKGMSEEDAIADFGPVDDLAANILEAYHVRPDYASSRNVHRFFHRKKKEAEAASSPEESEASPFEKMRERAGNGFRCIASQCRRACGAVLHGAQRLGRGLKAGWMWFVSLLKKPFAKGKPDLPDETGETAVSAKNLSKEELTEKKRSKKAAGHKEQNPVLRSVCDFSKFCIAAFCWCLKWCWNLFCIGAGVMLGTGACIVLFALGVLVVLLAQGYPLLGVTVGVTGLTMCLAAATVFCFLAVIRKKKPEALENEKEEVYHA